MLRNQKTQLVIAERVELMNNPAKRSKGLLKYSEAPSNYAAVFNLPLYGFFPVVHTIGMRFSIDMVFCSPSKEVCFVQRAVPPGRLVAPWRYLLGGAPYLIELSECRADLIQMGDILEWEETS